MLTKPYLAIRKICIRIAFNKLKNLLQATQYHHDYTKTVEYGHRVSEVQRAEGDKQDLKTTCDEWMR